eukprot:9494954-Pyramimonas_sp.AAC.1
MVPLVTAWIVQSTLGGPRRQSGVFNRGCPRPHCRGRCWTGEGSFSCSQDGKQPLPAPTPLDPRPGGTEAALSCFEDEAEQQQEEQEGP